MNEFYQMTKAEALAQLQVTETGLFDQDIEARRKQYGRNALTEAKKPSTARVFFSQFHDFLIWILLVAAAISAFLGKLESAVVIAVVILINAILGTVQHLKAEKSIMALKALSSPKSKVIRNGQTLVIPSEDVVVGDVMVIEAGDFISADGRILTSSSLKIDESALTGESVSAEKDILPIEKGNLSPGDQKNMVFAGTHVTYGRGTAVITAVGELTEIGKIATLLKNAKEKETPLQRSLNDFGKKLTYMILAIAALIFFVNIYRGSAIVDVLMFSISLAVAAIPEALSSIVTIVLAIGTRRMANENAIIRKLHAVEGLGSVSVICSDKTGTLTQNKMTVKNIYTRNQLLKEDELNINEAHDLSLLQMSMLCNDAITSGQQEIGDPTEIALVKLGEIYGWDEESLRGRYPRQAELPFDSNRKLMSTLHDFDGKRILVTKGALDVVLERAVRIDDKDGVRAFTPQDKAHLEEINGMLSQKGLRILAFAYKDFHDSQLSLDDEYELTFIGLIAMMDPPRVESAEAVKTCHKAGIRTVMITGDHIITASAIAKEIGILDHRFDAIEGSKLESMTDEELKAAVPNIAVYARVSPTHKIRIVKAWQDLGYSVAMTGDGVNDAPALKQADIGVAMGITGTEVSKDAASMVLADDNFVTIVKAIGNGRSIYENIKNSVKFLLSGNTAGILAVLYASITNLPVPFAPVHLLFINLLTDSMPAIAIGIESPKSRVLKDKPRNIQEPLLTKPFAIEVLYQGFLIAIATMLGFHIGLQVSTAAAVTMAFAVLCQARLIHGFNCRTREPLSFKLLFSNGFSWVAFLVGTLLLGLVLTWRPLQDVFEVASLTAWQYGMLFTLALLPTLVIQLAKWTKYLWDRSRDSQDEVNS